MVAECLSLDFYRRLFVCDFHQIWYKGVKTIYESVYFYEYTWTASSCFKTYRRKRLIRSYGLFLWTHGHSDLVNAFIERLYCNLICNLRF